MIIWYLFCLFILYGKEQREHPSKLLLCLVEGKQIIQVWNEIWMSKRWQLSFFVKSTPSKNMQRWEGGLLSLQVDIILSTTEQVSH